jgi:hypothetical protein
MNCDICKKPLSEDPKKDNYNCGGTCMRCMASFDDPECKKAIAEIDGIELEDEQ